MKPLINLIKGIVKFPILFIGFILFCFVFIPLMLFSELEDLGSGKGWMNDGFLDKRLNKLMTFEIFNKIYKW